MENINYYFNDIDTKGNMQNHQHSLESFEEFMIDEKKKKRKRK